MKELGNKLLLFVACSYLIRYAGLTTAAIFAFTFSLSVSGICTYIGNRTGTGILIISYAGLSLFAPDLSLFLPLFAYDAIYHRRYRALIAVAAAGMFGISFLSLPLIFPIIVLYLCSILLALYTSRIETLEQELHQIRDRGREAEIHLQERNAALIEKQNYEIHLATLSERNRIAREIHDNVGHLLSRSILQTGALKVINREPALNEPLSTLHDTLNTAMTSIRCSVHDLHDESIDLKQTMEELAAGMKNPPITLDYDITGTVPRQVKYAFISIVREALNNMQKHSNADSGTIILREHPGFFRLQIRDNGTLSHLPLIRDGIGISNMKERVHTLGGNFEINTEHGFCINISILKKGNADAGINY